MATIRTRTDALMFVAMAIGAERVDDALGDDALREALRMLVEEAISDGKWPLEAAEVEAAGNRLVAADLVAFVEDRLTLTSEGDALWRSVRRFALRGQLDRIEKALKKVTVVGGHHDWVLPPSSWQQAVNDFDLWERQKFANRLHIVEGLLSGIADGVEILRLSLSSPSRVETYAALMRPPFSLSEVQALHVLDMQVARFSQASRQELEDEAVALRVRHGRDAGLS